MFFRIVLFIWEFVLDVAAVSRQQLRIVERKQERRPHQGIDQDSPLGLEPALTEGPIRYRNVLGGIIRDYYRIARLPEPIFRGRLIFEPYGGMQGRSFP